MALLALAHGDARAVPEALRRLGGLVVVVAAGAQGGPELVLVLCEALDDDGGDGLVDAEVGAGAVGSFWEGWGGVGWWGGRRKETKFLSFPVVKRTRRGLERKETTLLRPSSSLSSSRKLETKRKQLFSSYRFANCSENLRMVSSVLTSGSAVFCWKIRSSSEKTVKVPQGPRERERGSRE